MKYQTKQELALTVMLGTAWIGGISGLVILIDHYPAITLSYLGVAAAVVVIWAITTYDWRRKKKPAEKMTLAQAYDEIRAFDGPEPVAEPVLVPFIAPEEPYPYHTERVSPGQGGCWFCHTASDVMAFDTEFDTAVHIDCLKRTLALNPDHPEAQHMRYLLDGGEQPVAPSPGEVAEKLSDNRRKMANDVVPEPIGGEPEADHVERLKLDVAAWQARAIEAETTIANTNYDFDEIKRQAAAEREKFNDLHARVTQRLDEKIYGLEKLAAMAKKLIAPRRKIKAETRLARIVAFKKALRDHEIYYGYPVDKAQS